MRTPTIGPDGLEEGCQVAYGEEGVTFGEESEAVEDVAAGRLSGGRLRGSEVGQREDEEKEEEISNGRKISISPKKNHRSGLSSNPAPTPTPNPE